MSQLSSTGFQHVPHIYAPVLVAVLIALAPACGSDTSESQPSHDAGSDGGDPLDAAPDADRDSDDGGRDRDVDVGGDAVAEVGGDSDDFDDDPRSDSESEVPPDTPGDSPVDGADTDAGGHPNFGTVTALAGAGVTTFGDGPATTAELNASLTGSALHVDGAGAVLIADRHHNAVRLYDPMSDTVSTVAGRGVYGPPFHGLPATSAWLLRPTAVDRDLLDRITFADSDLAEVMAIGASSGTLVAVAGRGASPGENIPATTAQVCRAHGLATDSNGHVYYADSCRHQVRRVDRDTGLVSTLAGDLLGEPGSGLASEGGTIVAVALDNPLGIEVVGDANGTLLIADSGNDRLIGIDLGTDTVDTEVALAGISDVAAGADDDLYVAAGGVVYRRSGEDAPTAIAGGGESTADGAAATDARLGRIEGLGYDASAERIVVLSDGGTRLRAFAEGGNIQTLAGGPWALGDGGPAIDAVLNQPCRLANRGSALAFTDNLNFRVRTIDPVMGSIDTVAGIDGPGAPVDGEAALETALTFNPCPTDGLLTLLSDGTIVVAQQVGGPRLWSIPPDSPDIQWLAGNGQMGLTGDGQPAVDAALAETGIRQLLSDSDDRVYIVTEHRIRRIDEGTIDAYAGDGGTVDAGDGGSAVDASFAPIRGAAMGPDDAIYVNTGRIRRVTTDGLVDSPFDSAPFGPVAVDADGRVYVGQSSSIVRLVRGGDPVVVAGGNGTGDSGDGGPALEAQFGTVTDLAILDDGRMVVVDSLAYRLRVITP